MSARQTEAFYRRLERQRAAADARAAVRAHEELVSAITSLHRRCGPVIDWGAVAEAGPPPEPAPPRAPDRSASEAARARLGAFRPGFFEWFRNERDELQAQLDRELIAERESEAAAEAAHAQAMAEWRESVHAHEEALSIAQRIRDGDVSGYADAIKSTHCLNEILVLVGDTFTKLAINEKRITLDLDVDPDRVVPKDVVNATSKGISTKAMPQKQRMEIFADFVCGAALRAAREVLAVTPIPLVVVHIDVPAMTPTGHIEKRTALSVACPRERLAEVNWAAADASDFVATLEHRMKLKRGEGFAAVERLS